MGSQSSEWPQDPGQSRVRETPKAKEKERVRGQEEKRKEKTQRKKVREEGRGGRGEPLFARVVDQELPPRRGRWWHWRSGGW